jgi:hypothetical protein
MQFDWQLVQEGQIFFIKEYPLQKAGFPPLHCPEVTKSSSSAAVGFLTVSWKHSADVFNWLILKAPSPTGLPTCSDREGTIAWGPTG